MAKGDDGTLRGIVALLEERGFTIVGAEQIAPGLLPPAGVPTRLKPLTSHEDDALVGMAEIAKMGRADTGQACVVAQGTVRDREDRAGTDALLARVRSSARMGDLAVLVKAPKPGQDRRVDLPVIGPETAVGAVGLSGIIIQAGGVMVVDLPRVVGILDRNGIFLWVRP
jgi:DUF1009 family protein